MKYLIFLVVMFSAIASAQQSPSCMKLDKVMTVPNVLQQKGANMVSLSFKTHNCYVLQNEPAVVSFQAPSGLDVAVNNTHFSSIDPSSVGTSAERAKQMIVLLKIAASPDLLLGNQALHPVMSYKVTDKSGNVSPETLAFDIPFRVVPPGDPRRHPAFAERHPVWIKVMLPLLIIVYIPVCLVRMLLGMDGCGS